jgi:hypothetical protein
VVEKGTFSATVKDNRGNKYLVPTLNTNFLYPTQKPIITSDKSTEFCTDGSARVELTANAGTVKSYVWSSGESSQKISVGSSAEFTVRGKSEFGCFSEISEKIVVRANPTPAQPKIAVSPANNVCEGQAISLNIETNDKIFWSNGATTKTIQADKVGNYDFSVNVTNEFGCVSLPALNQKLSINALPKQPSISQIGLFHSMVQTENFNQPINLNGSEKIPFLLKPMWQI